MAWWQRMLAKALWHDGNSNSSNNSSSNSSNTNRSNSSNSFNSSNCNNSINSSNSINSNNSNSNSSKATATTAATARLRVGWRGAGRVGGQKGGPQCNNMAIEAVGRREWQERDGWWWDSGGLSMAKETPGMEWNIGWWQWRLCREAIDNYAIKSSIARMMMMMVMI